MKKPSWYRILEEVRRISSKGEIHSQTLGTAAELDPSDASAWLCKLARWGYLRRAGSSELGGKTVRYELTDYGRSVKAPKRRHYGS